MIAVALGISAAIIVIAPARADSDKFGYVPSKPGVFERQPMVQRFRAFLPASIDLSKHFPTPGTQDSNSCTGWAVGYAARSYYTSTLEGRDIRKLENVPSPSYIYQSVRDPSNCDSGALLISAMGVLTKGGLSAREFPLRANCRRPSEAEREAASSFKIKGWLGVDPHQPDDVKGQLARGNPVIFGTDVGEGFVHLAGSSVYQGEAKSVGTHAMTVVGYDDQRQAFKVINSWGSKWADGGFGWISYEAFKKDVREAYILDVEMQNVKVQDSVDAVVPKPVARPVPSNVPSDKLPDDQVVKPVERPVNDSDCSYVYSETVAGKSQLTGFVGSERELSALRAQWSGYVDGVDVQVRPWPQCEVLLTLGSAIEEKGAPVLSTKDHKRQFVEGDEMIFELKTPSKPSYIYVSYIQADGSVVSLMQPGSDLSPTLRRRSIVFGDGEGGSARFRATKPLGNEMVLAIASDSPLFEGSLPMRQTEREFLSALRKAILYKSDRSQADRKLSAAFLGIETEAKK